MGSLDRVSTLSSFITQSLPSAVRVAWLKSTPPGTADLELAEPEPELGEGRLGSLSVGKEAVCREKELSSPLLENLFEFLTVVVGGVLKAWKVEEVREEGKDPDPELNEPDPKDPEPELKDPEEEEKELELGKED